MHKLAIFKFFIPFAIITSVFSGLVYNLLYFLNVQVIESQWSIFFDANTFSILMALSFILFAIILIISMRWIEKILNEKFIIIGILLIGFCCIFASLIMTWGMVVFVFMVSSIVIAFIIPMLGRYISNIVRNKYQNSRYKLVFPICGLIWALISLMLFTLFGVYWRFLYLFTGIINIIGSFAFIFV